MVENLKKKIKKIVMIFQILKELKKCMIGSKVMAIYVIDEWLLLNGGFACQSCRMMGSWDQGSHKF